MADYQILWAKSKPYCSLADHLVITGRCAAELLRNGVISPIVDRLCKSTGLMPEELISLISYLASLHDIGKAHPFFQAKDKAVPNVDILISEGLLGKKAPPVFRHEEYSSIILEKLLPTVLDTDTAAIKAIGAAVRMHHQGKGKSEKTLIPHFCNPSEWKRLQNQINGVLINEFHPPKKHFFGNSDAFIYLLMGTIILSDWVASGITEIGSDIASEIRARGLGDASEIAPFDHFCDFCTFITFSERRGIQQAADILAKDPAPLYIIEAPMGEGKSEAALFMALSQMRRFGANGFYAALPTSATGNQMFNRVNDLFGMHEMKKSRLIHGTAWMIDDNSEPSGTEPEPESVQWLAPLRRAMLSRFAVGTIDQAMLSVMRVKYGVLRLLGLAGKVLVLDEIHAYDTYMQTIIERLLTWCRALGVPVILLSATLPKQKKLSMLNAYGAECSMDLSSDYPLITAMNDDGSVREYPVGQVHMRRQYRIELFPIMTDAEKTAALAANMVRDTGCICVLVNTVDKAQKVYRALQSIDTNAEVLLFHARFPVEKRNEIEKTVVSKFGKHFENRPKKSILVATQVMEQSIDADFDAMITDMAPIDLILQRLGRVHRFDDTPRPESLKTPKITVLTSPTGYDDKTVYPGILMKRTEDLLSKTDTVKTPDQIRALVEAVYGTDLDDDEVSFEMWAKYTFKNQLEAAQADGGVLPKPALDYPSFADNDFLDFSRSDDESDSCSAKTRIGDGSSRIILVPMSELPFIPDSPSRREAKALMLKSASIRTAKLGSLPHDARLAEGLLAGNILLPTDDGVAHWGDYIIYNDDELGIMIEKE